MVEKSHSSSLEEIPIIEDGDPNADHQDAPTEVNFFSAKKIYLSESNPPSVEKSVNTNSLDTSSLEHSDQDVVLSSEITSDSEASLINCYDVTESVVYRKLSKEEEEIQTAEKFFDFESLEASLVHEEVNSFDQEQVKPVAKPRTRLTSSPGAESKMQTVATDGYCKLLKYKETPEDSFDAIPYVINRRSDNTLIKKIYSDPSVRSFALNNRNKLPISIEEQPSIRKKAQTVKAPVEREPTTTQKKEEKKPSEVIPSTPRKEINNNKEFEEKYGDIDCFYAREFAKVKDDNDTPGEIDKLKEQKLVSSLLKAFSKSSINLSRIPDENLDQSFSSGFDGNKIVSLEMESCDKDQIFQNGERSTSVKDLRKKFEQFDAKAKSEKPILYSLTGRSISKQFKERLKGVNQDSFTLSQIHSLSLTNLEVEENTR